MAKYHDRKIYLTDIGNEFLFSKKLNKKNISFNRVAFVFFFFVFISLIISVKIFYYGSISAENLAKKKILNKSHVRADIIDSEGNFLAKTVNKLILKNSANKKGVIPSSIIGLSHPINVPSHITPKK